MVTMIVCLLIGAFIGWNLPQPAWATKLQARAIAAVRRWMA